MNLSCSSKMIKYLMFGFNLIFVISGIIIIAVGTAVKTVYTEYADFLDTKYFSLPNMLIATGAFIFMVSFFGCCGAIKESWILLGIFSIFLCIIFIFEFACGIAGYVLRDNTYDYLDTTLRRDLKDYNNTHYVWDLVQETFECCGVDNYTDWNGILSNHDLPLSCCPRKSGTVGSFYCNSFQGLSTNSTETPTVVTTAATTPASTIVTTTASTDPPTTTKKGTDNSDAQGKRRRRNIIVPLDTEIVSTTPQSSTTSPYEIGCKSAFGDYIKKHAVQIGGCALGLAVLQILGIAFSCHLVRQLKNGYYST